MKFSEGQFPVHIKTTGEIAIVTSVVASPDALVLRVPTMGQEGIHHNSVTLREFEVFTHEEFLANELATARERIQMNKKFNEISRELDSPETSSPSIPSVN